jgi:molybdate transport system ATP-binding protein
LTAVFEISCALPLAHYVLEIEVRSSARTLAVFGPSGSGKTSLLEVVTGWRRPTRGRIVVAGRTIYDSERGIDLPLSQRGIGYVPQDLLLLPDQSTRKNVLFGPRAQRALFPRVVEILELGAVLDRACATLSGGERQRVALARALCSGPEALLLDEPLASLDLPLRRRILPYLVRVREEFRMPMLYVSHDAPEVGVLCEEVVFLRDGKLVAQGSPRDLFSDSWRRELLDEGIENILRGTVAEVSGEMATLTLAGGLPLEVSCSEVGVGERVVLGIRSDDILVALAPPTGLSARNALPAVVEELDACRMGIVLRAVLDGSAESLDVVLTRKSTEALALRVGARVFLVVKSNSVRILSHLSAPKPAERDAAPGQA